jgi:hemerythrin-like metal-binding protein
MCPQRSCSDGSAAHSGTLSAGVAAPGSFPMVLVWQDPGRLRAVHMDRQHRRIFAILGWIRCLEADDRRGAETALNVLTASMRRHFIDEENLLAGHGYPVPGDQRGAHERCLDRLRGYREQLDEGRYAGMAVALERVGIWFARHLEEDDKAYGRWLRAMPPARGPAARAGG